MTEQLTSMLASVRERLAELEIPIPPTSTQWRDQAQASFRLDMVSLGLDPADKVVLESAIAGFATAVKPMIQQNLPLILVSQFIGLCETLVPMIEADSVDVSALPDLDFLSDLALPEPEPEPGPAASDVAMCDACGMNPAAVGNGNAKYCITCGIAEGVITMHTMARPQIGGPNFNRGPDEVADVGPTRLWDRKVSELFRRQGKRRRNDG